MDVEVGMRASSANGEAVQAVIRFGPPAVQNGQIQSTVEHHLLSAGARCFQWPARIVEPYIDSLHEVTAHVDVIVFDKGELVAELRISHHLRNLLKNTFARLVMGMGLPGKHELDRAFGVVDHRGKLFQVPQDQVGAFVSGEAASKPDSQRIGTKTTLEFLDRLTRLVATLRLLD